MQASVASLGYAPDRAIRARANALVLDGVVLGIVSRLLIPRLGAHSVPAAIFDALAIQFVYFFVQEFSRGQTLGKRAMGVRVVQLDGTAPTPRQLAVRNALRVFDAVPIFYASGLISVMWSGPARRQRIGDRAADTTVILLPGAKVRQTPAWLLPVLTVGSVLFSVVVYGALYDKYRTPNVDSNAMIAPVVAGFAGDNTQQPSIGVFSAEMLISGQPAIDPVTRRPVIRTWWIDKRCSGGACSFWLKRTTDSGEEDGQLSAAADGWHVSFPTRAYRMRCFATGSIITVLARAAFVLHFEPGGHAAEAHEVHAYHSSSCGDKTSTLDWSASQTPTLSG